MINSRQNSSFKKDISFTNAINQYSKTVQQRIKTKSNVKVSNFIFTRRKKKKKKDGINEAYKRDEIQ